MSHKILIGQLLEESVSEILGREQGLENGGDDEEAQQKIANGEAGKQDEQRDGNGEGGQSIMEDDDEDRE